MSRDGSVEIWSRQIKTPDELANDYASAIRNAFNEFPYCVRTPPERAFHDSYPEQLLSLGESRIALLWRKRGVVNSIIHNLASIDVLESETTLLASRLKVYPREGNPFAVPYNAVGESLFKPFIAAFKDARGTKVSESDMLRSLKPHPFHYLITQDYRYHSYVFEALPDDSPKAHFYHPVTHVPLFLQRWRIISAYLLIASPSMLYCLSEEPPLRSSRQAEYSIKFRYMPYSSGVRFGIEARGKEERFQTLSIHAGLTTFTIPLAIEKRTMFESFEHAVDDEAR
jgi:hypothetical protein